ncbi:hypothetical protein ONZ45_g3332 [Pleurotus djamor]|nr:hypothetical protein ONZ45_g3332 [Pleurotus djamor]
MAVFASSWRIPKYDVTPHPSRILGSVLLASVCLGEVEGVEDAVEWRMVKLEVGLERFEYVKLRLAWISIEIISMNSRDCCSVPLRVIPGPATSAPEQRLDLRGPTTKQPLLPDEHDSMGRDWAHLNQACEARQRHGKPIRKLKILCCNIDIIHSKLQPGGEGLALTG